MKPAYLLLPAVLLAACSDTEPEAEPVEPAVVAPVAGPAATPTPAAPAQADVLTREGLGPLRVGEQVPEGTGWAERGAQISDTCRTISSPDYPGVYAIVEGDRVRRISVGEGSSVRFGNSIGPGSSEEELRRAFPGLREAPHVYVEAPAKYLTEPGDDPRLRFEIDAEGRVSQAHVGTMPVLGYVEGCA